MSYTHQGAMQRVCEEVERVVWPIDRDFAQKGRRYWVRPAEEIEVSERELMDGTAAPPVPSGWRAYVAVNAWATGIRIRLPFLAPDIGDEWRKLSEGQCAYQFSNCLARNWEGTLLKPDRDRGAPGEVHP